MFSAGFSETDVWMSPIVTALSVFFFNANAFGLDLAAGIVYSILVFN
jgi:hypothetical protein